MQIKYIFLLIYNKITKMTWMLLISGYIYIYLLYTQYIKLIYIYIYNERYMDI